jgi:hypothetical protein
MHLHHGILHPMSKYDGSSADKIAAVGVPKIGLEGGFSL